MAGSRRYHNALQVWETMAAEAVPIGQLAGRDRYLAGMVPVGCMGVWIGSFVNFMRGLGLASTAQYHEVKGALVQMGCIAQLRRGAGYTPSAWALLARPTQARWERHIGQLSRRHHARARQLREHHDQALVEFLQRPPESDELRQVVKAARARTGAELVAFLAALPLARQRTLGLPCLANHAVGAVHTCGLVDEAADLLDGLTGEVRQATPALGLTAGAQ